MREPEAEEPLPGAKLILFEFEINEVAEPKGLLPADLRDLVLWYSGVRFFSGFDNNSS